MSREVRFERDEIDLIQAICRQARTDLADKIFAEFRADRAGEALGFVLAMLAASAFTEDTEQQHDAALSFNQVLSRWPHPIRWRMAPNAGT
jgi:hypothetical protein